MSRHSSRSPVLVDVFGRKPRFGVGPARWRRPRRRPSVVSVAFEDTAWRSFVELLRCSPLSKVEMQGRYAHHRYRVQDDVFLGKDQVPPFSFRMVRRQGNSSWRCSSSKAVASVETRSCSRFRIGVYLCLVVVFVCRCGVVFLDSVVRNGLSFSCTQTSIFYKIKVRNCVLSKKKILGDFCCKAISSKNIFCLTTFCSIIFFQNVAMICYNFLL